MRKMRQNDHKKMEEERENMQETSSTKEGGKVREEKSKGIRVGKNGESEEQAETIKKRGRKRRARKRRKEQEAKNKSEVEMLKAGAGQ